MDNIDNYVSVIDMLVNFSEKVSNFEHKIKFLAFSEYLLNTVDNQKNFELRAKISEVFSGLVFAYNLFVRNLDITYSLFLSLVYLAGAYMFDSILYFYSELYKNKRDIYKKYNVKLEKNVFEQIREFIRSFDKKELFGVNIDVINEIDDKK